MRFQSLASLVVLAVLAPQAVGDDEPVPLADSTQRVLELAKKYEFFASSDRKVAYTLRPKPLLSYSNPVRGDVYGNVFVWTLAGRPEVVAAVFDFRSEDKLDTELHLLSRAGSIGVRDGDLFWQPTSAGVQFRPVPEAPRVAQTTAAGSPARSGATLDVGQSRPGARPTRASVASQRPSSPGAPSRRQHDSGSGRGRTRARASAHRDVRSSATGTRP